MLKFIAISFILIGSASAELVATFTQNGLKDTRLVRFPALFVPLGKPPTSFLSAGKFDVEWSGNIEIKERSRLYFSFEGRGNASLRINGEMAISEEGELGGAKSKRLRLNPGSHEISLKYSSPEDGSASFRLYWEQEGMARQTISPTAFASEPNEHAIQGELIRQGRMVFTDQNCAKCHAPAGGFGPDPMPETGEIAPILVGIGDRVSEQWLKNWIANPKGLKPNTHMPQLIDPSSSEGLQQVADLTAFLTASKSGAKLEKSAPDQELIKAGGAVFHELGCIACHYPADEEAKADGTNRVPLNHVASKFLPGQLVAFLKTPEAYHPYTAMPNFRLSDKEADSIAAFLQAKSEGKETKTGYRFPEGDTTRGAALAESLQCGTCHPGTPGGVSRSVGLEDIFKLDWAQKGCVSANDSRKGLPVPNLGEGDLEALLAFSKVGADSLKKQDLAEFAERQVKAKRCTACHALDGEPASLDSLQSSTAGLVAHLKNLDERVDQTRPQLTYVGEMLYTSYIESMLAGSVEVRPRTWLGARMPAYKAHSKPLAAGLSQLHGFEPSAPVKFKTDPELVKIGSSLAGSDGFGCNTCHGIGDVKPTAAFEVGAVNFSLVPERLREGYYYRWMDHPAGVIPGNKMPKYAEGNQSQRADVLDGDASKQYEAIWNWIQEQ
jgi:mono/diheme cytochrome c family protein